MTDMELQRLISELERIEISTATIKRELLRGRSQASDSEKLKKDVKNNTPRPENPPDVVRLLRNIRLVKTYGATVVYGIIRAQWSLRIKDGKKKQTISMDTFKGFFQSDYNVYIWDSRISDYRRHIQESVIEEVNKIIENTFVKPNAYANNDSSLPENLLKLA